MIDAGASPILTSDQVEESPVLTADQVEESQPKKYLPEVNRAIATVPSPTRLLDVAAAYPGTQPSKVPTNWTAGGWILWGVKFHTYVKQELLGGTPSTR